MIISDQNRISACEPLGEGPVKGVLHPETRMDTGKVKG